MERFSIIVLIFLASWSGTTWASETGKNKVSVCECLSVSRQDPLASACMELSNSLSDKIWDSETDECEAKVMRVIATNIQDCTAIVQAYVHPWTGEKLERRITGMKNGTCNYVVTMPKGGKMDCRFPPGKLKDIADYFHNSTRYKNARVKSSTRFVEGKQVTKNRYFIEGKEIRNPMQESLDSGECVVSGYKK